MDTIASNKMQPVARKAKKKQVKDEMDRLKQAEKKKRRLEKALATSAAIRAELEKKKQIKIEEQQRLDEEGAAIAEAVALRVLLGEDSDDSCKIVLNKDDEFNFNHWDCAANIDLLGGGLPHQDATDCSFEGIRWVSDTHGSGCDWGNGDWSYYSGSYGGNEEWGTAGYSAGLMAAQAVSSLHIADDSCVDTIVLNGMLRG